MALRDRRSTLPDEELPLPYGLAPGAPRHPHRARRSPSPLERAALRRAGADRLEELPTSYSRGVGTSPRRRARPTPIVPICRFAGGISQPARPRSTPAARRPVFRPARDVHVWRWPDGRFFLTASFFPPRYRWLYWVQVPGDLHFQRALAKADARARASESMACPGRGSRPPGGLHQRRHGPRLSEDPVLDGRSRILTLAGRSYRAPGAALLSHRLYGAHRR